MRTITSNAVVVCDGRHLQLFELRRSDIETFGRKLEPAPPADLTFCAPAQARWRPEPATPRQGISPTRRDSWPS